MIIRTVLEMVGCSLMVWMLFNENRLIKFEDHIKRLFTDKENGR